MILDLMLPLDLTRQFAAHVSEEDEQHLQHHPPKDFGAATTSGASCGCTGKWGPIVRHTEAHRQATKVAAEREMASRLVFVSPRARAEQQEFDNLHSNDHH